MFLLGGRQKSIRWSRYVTNEIAEELMGWPRRIGSIARRRQAERDLNDELQHHIELKTQEKIESGMSPKEARYAALHAFGGVAQKKERCRDADRLRWLEDLIQDVRFGLRQLRRNPGFTFIALLTLALGIGGATTMFTVIRTVLWKPLAYPDPDRVVQLSGGATSVRFREMQKATRSYASVGVYLNNVFDVVFSGGGEPEVLKGTSVSANFLEILRVPTLLGRSFRPEEDTAAGPNVTLISEGLWRGRFGADPAILGKTVSFNAIPYTVIGVLPASFKFPQPGIDVWIAKPLQFVNNASPLLSIFGRLHRGVSLQQANAELAVLKQQYRHAHPGMLDARTNVIERVVRLQDRIVDNVRSLLWILFGAVAFVLLIACANVASLLLARGASRTRELAVRAAIGASRARIVRQLLVETALLTIGGGAIAVLVARWILFAIAHMTALDLPRAAEIQLDPMVLGFAVLLSIATGILFGLAPALGASRPDLLAVLRTASGAANFTSVDSFGSRFSARGILVIAQVAFSMVLLIGSALLMRSLARLQGVDPGFNPAHLLTMHISLPLARYRSGTKQTAFFDELVQRVESLPGVLSAAACYTVPMTAFPRTPVQLANQPTELLNQRPLAAIQDVTSAFLRTLQEPLMRGREFSDRDTATAPWTAIINESLARRLWPEYPRGPDPVGQHLLIGARNDNVEIVGIVADAHQTLDKDPQPAVFRPFAQYPISAAGFLIRTKGDPLQLVNAVREQVRSLDRDQPITAVLTMDDLIASQGGRRRVTLLLLAGFAASALLLTLIGIYGITAYTVAQRTCEIGIRRALGAQNAEILRLVLGQGLRLALLGIAIGETGAYALTRVMKSLLFRISATDPATFAVIAVAFVFVTLFACYLPARRATKVDPMVALRYE
jgi:putative ABC transport system permease protein